MYNWIHKTNSKRAFTCAIIAKLHPLRFQIKLKYNTDKIQNVDTGLSLPTELIWYIVISQNFNKELYLYIDIYINIIYIKKVMSTTMEQGRWNTK